MIATQQPALNRTATWRVIGIYSLLLMALIGFGTFFDILTGMGFFYVYAIAYFNALVVVLPILKVGRFGVAMLVYLPAAIIGLFVEYYLEYVLNPVLVSPWSVVGFCVLLVATGLSADVAYRFLPVGSDLRWRAVLTGIVLSVTYFLTCWLAAAYFYRPGPLAPMFVDVAYWALPWLVLNAGFGGYTAYAMCRKS